MFVFDEKFYYLKYHTTESYETGKDEDGESVVKTTPPPTVKEQPYADFNLYSQEAIAIIRKYTFGRIDELENKQYDEIKGGEPLWYVCMCVCELTELIYIDKHNGGGENFGIKSETIGKWSRTYESGGERTNSFNKMVKNVIHKWLPSELLYRGVD